MYEELINNLEKGIQKPYFSFYGKNFEEGRISDQEYFDLYLNKKDEEKRLMRVSIYSGKKPYYNPWVEMFSIKDVLTFHVERFEYFGSNIEDEVLDIFTSPMEEGGRIFIEYQQDKETMKELSKGVPEVCSRLGYKLFKRGFTWFKDWYFSEGFHEGNQKLQGEKPIDEGHRNNHLDHIQNQLSNFLEKFQDQKDEDVKKKVITRAASILNEIED